MTRLNTMNNRQTNCYKRKKIFNLILTACLLSISFAGCDNGPRVKMAPGYEITPTRQDVNANLMGTPDATEVPPTPTPEPLILDNTIYSLPSQAFSLYTPQGWKLASEDNDYVRFESPDQKAWFEAAVESTGYQLDQENLEIYINNMLLSLYTGVEDFELLESQMREGQATFVSTFRKNGVIWFVYDVFIQRSQAVYALSFQVHELLWETYLPAFEAVTDSLETRTGYITDEMVYRFMRSYNSPNNQFTLTAPMGWTFKTGQQDVLEDAVVDTISAPDQQAVVEVVAYKDETGQDIGITSIGIMKELDGANIRVRANEVLQDGRVRADWQNDAENIRGFSFFWQDGSVVYVLTFKYSDVNTGAYQNASYRIGDSFAFTGS